MKKMLRRVKVAAHRVPEAQEDEPAARVDY